MFLQRTDSTGQTLTADKLAAEVVIEHSLKQVIGVEILHDPAQLMVVDIVDQCLVKIVVLAEHGGVIGLIDALDALDHLIDLGCGNPVAGQLQNLRLQQQTDVKAIGDILDGEIADENAAIRVYIDKLFFVQSVDRFAEWCSTGTQLFYDLLFVQRLSRRVLSAGDTFFDRVVDLVSQYHRLSPLHGLYIICIQNRNEKIVGILSAIMKCPGHLYQEHFRWIK